PLAHELQQLLTAHLADLLDREVPLRVLVLLPDDDLRERDAVDPRPLDLRHLMGFRNSDQRMAKLQALPAIRAVVDGPAVRKPGTVRAVEDGNNIPIGVIRCRRCGWRSLGAARFRGVTGAAT